MESWIIVLIVLSVYSFLLTLHTVISEYKGCDRNIGDLILCGIFSWLIFGIPAIYVLFKKRLRKIKYKSLIEDEQGNKYWCDFKKVNDILDNNENLKFAKNVDFKEYFKFWDKNDCVRDTPNMRYTPRKVWKKYKKYKDNHNGKNN